MEQMFFYYVLLLLLLHHLSLFGCVLRVETVFVFVFAVKGEFVRPTGSSVARLETSRFGSTGILSTHQKVRVYCWLLAF